MAADVHGKLRMTCFVSYFRWREHIFSEEICFHILIEYPEDECRSLIFMIDEVAQMVPLQ